MKSLTKIGSGQTRGNVETNLLFSAVGSFHMDDYTNSESTAFFVIFLFLVLIVMLNLLIAIMSDSFEKVMENWVVEVRTTNETKSAVREKP